MTALAPDYADAPLPVRADLATEHARVWRSLAAPGTWLDGSQRVAVAAETRIAPACPTCKAAADALAPLPSGTLHAVTNDVLPPLWIEVIHRVRNDASRLTDRWYSSLLGRGMDPGEYIEIVSVLAHVVAVDTFTDALGWPRHALPKPLTGEPSRTLPPGAKPGLGRVPTVAPEDVSQGEADLYEGLSGANIHRALSLVPAEVWSFFALDAVMYLPDRQLRDFEHEFRAIDHAQIELVAARVSALNECYY